MTNLPVNDDFLIFDLGNGWKESRLLLTSVFFLFILIVSMTSPSSLGNDFITSSSATFNLCSSWTNTSFSTTRYIDDFSWLSNSRHVAPCFFSREFLHGNIKDDWLNIEITSRYLTPYIFQLTVTLLYFINNVVVNREIWRVSVRYGVKNSNQILLKFINTIHMLGRYQISFPVVILTAR